MSFERTCRTGVKTGLPSPMFRDCGAPATEIVVVGFVTCHYCSEHAAAARRFVERQGHASIKDVQMKQRVIG